MNNKKQYDYILKKYGNILIEQEICQPSNDIDSFDIDTLDNRVWTSNIEDIDDGDNFVDYCKEFFKLLDEEEYYD